MDYQRIVTFSIKLSAFGAATKEREPLNNFQPILHQKHWKNDKIFYAVIALLAYIS